MLDLGPIVVSARDPARLDMEGCAALLIAAILRWQTCDRRRALLVTLLLAAYFVALIAESSPRRVGDGYEYVAMARQIAARHPPGLTSAEAGALASELGGLPGYESPRWSVPALVAADGRQEFVHFWTYPLVVAPLLAAASAAGIHWNHAFTAVNAGLLLALACVVVRRTHLSLALALLTGPIIWWIDKAHVEVFTFALLGLCVALWTEAPSVSILLAGVLTSQNPAFALVLAAIAVPALTRAPSRAKLVPVVAGAGLIAAANPLYYLWRLGHLSPLAGAAAWTWPSFTAVVTPFLDPLAGIVWYYPWVLVAAAILFAGWSRRVVARRADRAILLAAAACLAFVFAQSGNINHGGTPGPSRYGVWLLPLILAWAPGLEVDRGWRSGALKFVAVASIVHAAVAFHPKVRENSWVVPRAAMRLVEQAPSIYNPLPEVFAERFGRMDGPARLPVASPSCAKVLLAGRGQARMSWPIPCVPQAVPPDCLAAGRLCYANRRPDGTYAFAAPPRQDGFEVADDSTDLVWSDVSEFAALPVPLPWRDLRETPPLSERSIVRDAEHVRRIRAYQSDAAAIAFVEPLDEQAPRVRIRPGAPARLWWMRRAGLAIVAAGEIAAESWVDAPAAEPLVLLVVAEPRIPNPVYCPPPPIGTTCCTQASASRYRGGSRCPGRPAADRRASRPSQSPAM